MNLVNVRYLEFFLDMHQPFKVLMSRHMLLADGMHML